MKFQLHPTATKSDITLVVDAKYLAYRTRYTPAFKLSSATHHTGLMFGFLNTMQHLAKKFKPINTVFMWDTTPVYRSKRKREFPGYKERKRELNSEELDDEQKFSDSYSLMMHEFNLLGFAGYTLDGYEADDLIALWCKRFNKTGVNVIVTRDEDMYQCLSPNTEIYNIDDKIFKDEQWFQKTYGITPRDWPLIKAIGGCTSDTIPGVPGIGEATALKYLKGGLSEKQSKKIQDHIEDVELYLSLTTLPFPDLKDYQLGFKYSNLDLDAFISFCQINGFRQFMEHLNDFSLFSKGDQKW